MTFTLKGPIVYVFLFIVLLGIYQAMQLIQAIVT